MRSQAKPFVQGKRIGLACRMRHGPVWVGEFSCHWAAVAALVRLTHPDFKSIGGDKQADLAVEEGLAARIEATLER